MRFCFTNVTLSFVHLVTPREQADGSAKYSMECIIDPKEDIFDEDWNKVDMNAVYEAARHVASERFPKGPPGNFRWKIPRPATDFIGAGKTDYEAPQYQDRYVVSVSNASRPALRDLERNLIEASEFYSGAVANVSLSMYCYPSGETWGPGQSMGLDGVQLVSKGDRLDGRPDGDALFAGVPTAGPGPMFRPSGNTADAGGPPGFPPQQAQQAGPPGFPPQQAQQAGPPGFPPQQAQQAGPPGFPPQQAQQAGPPGFPPQQGQQSGPPGFPPFDPNR